MYREKCSVGLTGCQYAPRTRRASLFGNSSRSQRPLSTSPSRPRPSLSRSFSVIGFSSFFAYSSSAVANPGFIGARGDGGGEIGASSAGWNRACRDMARNGCVGSSGAMFDVDGGGAAASPSLPRRAAEAEKARVRSGGGGLWCIRHVLKRMDRQGPFIVEVGA